MQIHGPSDEADTADFRVYLNPGTDRPFASVQMGHVGFYAYTPEECDAAISVWVEAKSLLLAAPAQDDECPIEAHFPDESYPCTLKRGHAGQHSFDGQIVQDDHDHDDADLPWTSGAHQFIPCTACTADACNACSRPAGDAVHRIAGDFGAQQVSDAPDRCPDCGRASCTGEDCYWPDEAGIRRPERDAPGTIAGDFGAGQVTS